MDASIEQNPQVLEAMKQFDDKLEPYRKVIGNTTFVFTRRDGAQETALGNLVTDSFRYYPWNDTDISFVNNGGLRSSITKGTITIEDVYAVLPFNDTLYKVDISGKAIKQVLSEKLSHGGKSILQISGAKLFYRKDTEGLWHLDRVEVPCQDKRELFWCEISDDKIYKVVLTSFLFGGGDGWTFPKHYQFSEMGHEATADSLKIYVSQRSPITHYNSHGRISFAYDSKEPAYSINTTFAVLCINVIVVLVFLAGLRTCYFKPQDTSNSNTLEIPYQNFE